MRPILLCLIFLLPIGNAAAASAVGAPPQDTLDQYFAVLTTRQIETLPGLIDRGSMASLKVLMDKAIRLQLTRGSRDLLERMFGPNATPDIVETATSEHYLRKLAIEILSAAEMQRFFVDRRDILGRIDEGDEMVHYVVRLYMHQESASNSDLLVYTLVLEDGAWKLRFPPIIRQTLAVIEAMVQRSAPPARKKP